MCRKAWRFDSSLGHHSPSVSIIQFARDRYWHFAGDELYIAKLPRHRLHPGVLGNTHHRLHTAPVPRNLLPCAKLPTPCSCALIRRFAHHFSAALARLWSVPARFLAFCVSVATGFPPCLCGNSGLSIRCFEVCLRRCIALGSVEDFVEAVRRAYVDLQGLLHFFRTSVLIVVIL